MSIGGEIMEEHYDKLIQAFYQFLADKGYKAPEPERTIIKGIIEAYKYHFKGNGIYGAPEEWTIEYADGLIINLKDKDPNEYEPCTCACHKHPKGQIHHIMPCCNRGWKRKKNVQIDSESPMLGKAKEDSSSDRSNIEPRY